MNTNLCCLLCMLLGLGAAQNEVSEVVYEVHYTDVTPFYRVRTSRGLNEAIC